VCSLHRLTGIVTNMGGNVAILSAAACRAGTRKAHDFTGGATWCSCQTVTHREERIPIRHGRGCLHSDLFRVSRPSNPTISACHLDRALDADNKYQHAEELVDAEHRLNERG